MSNVIVLSDSESEPASPVADKHDKIGSEIYGKYYSDATSDFDLPEVPFHYEIAGNSTSQSDSLPDSNANGDCERDERLSDSEDDRIEGTSQKRRKATVPKKNKVTLSEERARRRQALAREKALRAIEKKTSKNIKPGECMKFMEVNLDRGIDAVAFRGEIESTLQNAGIKFNITIESIPNSITWQRNIEEDFIGEDNELRTKRSIQTEGYAIVIWSNCEAVRHVAKDTFCTSVLNSKTLMSNCSMTLVICGMEDYFAYLSKKQKSNKNSGKKGYNDKHNQRFDTLPIISRQQLEMCLTEIQIVAKCSSRLIENAQDLALMVYQYTKSIAEIPYKLQKKGNQEGKFDWYVMGDNKNTIRVDKDGNGLKRLWQQQLCQFNLSSLETSEAICIVYSSPVQLVKAYRKCTPDEGMNLLKDIPIRRAAGPLTTVRKIGPELSKKIYMMFMSQNGDALLGT